MMPAQSIAMFSRSEAVTSSGPKWSSLQSIHVGFHGQSVRVPPRSHPFRAPQQPRPKLLPHTKRAEYAVEHVLDVHRSYQLFKSADRCPEMNRGNGHRKFPFSPCSSELIDLRTGSADRL